MSSEFTPTQSDGRHRVARRRSFDIADLRAFLQGSTNPALAELAGHERAIALHLIAMVEDAINIAESERQRRWAAEHAQKEAEEEREQAIYRRNAETRTADELRMLLKKTKDDHEATIKHLQAQCGELAGCVAKQISMGPIAPILITPKPQEPQ